MVGDNKRYLRAAPITQQGAKVGATFLASDLGILWGVYMVGDSVYLGQHYTSRKLSCENRNSQYSVTQFSLWSNISHMYLNSN